MFYNSVSLLLHCQLRKQFYNLIFHKEMKKIVVGSNPGTIYWMDVSDASYYIKIKNPKIMKIKVAEWGTPKKIF